MTKYNPSLDDAQGGLAKGSDTERLIATKSLPKLPSRSLKELHELAKDTRISELENRLRIVTEFAQLMKELAEENDD